MSELHDQFTSRVVLAVMGGLEWLEDAAKRGSWPCERDFQNLLNMRARLAVLCHEFRNNRNGVSREEHNRRLDLR